MPNHDDEIRSPKGVVISLRKMGDGTSRLIFDDVTGHFETNSISWSFDCFYTSRDYLDEVLDQMKLDDRKYQMIGENLVARLLAVNGRA